MVKKGYKQTEIGLIPEDWELKSLSEIGVFSKGKGIKKDEVIDEGIPCVRYGELYTKYDNIITEVSSFISLETSKNSNKIKQGDILFAGSGETKEEIGKCATLNLNIDTYAGGDVIVMTPSNTNSLLLGYLLNSDKVQKQKSQKGQGDAVVHIYPSGLSKMKIPLPPTLTEQKAIATALTDIDNLITNLESLITKKKAIKQGAMQQLLTGKKRLKGFTGEWETKKLGEVANMSSGGTPLISIREYYNGSIPWMVIADITKTGKYINTTEKKITALGVENSNTVIYPKETLFFAIYASIGKCTISKVEMTCNQAILGIITHSINTEYLFYYLFSLENKLKDSGQTGTQSNLNKEMVMNLNIPYPEIKEQKAIAQILSDMDKEIEALEQQKSKTQHLKQGMMQELLTGKTRLVKFVSQKTEKPLAMVAEPEPTYKKEKKHNEYFNDAVLIGTMANAFGSEKFPLTRFMYTKVSYLLKRYKEEQDAGYLKKAAGPYKPKTHYGGAEKIALDNNYIKIHTFTYKGKTCEGFLGGQNVGKAVEYFKEWYGKDALQWMIRQFKYIKHDQLELWTTIDMAMEDLKQDRMPVNFETIKQLINNHKEWQPKLQRSVFSDENIKEAIKKLNKLFKT